MSAEPASPTDETVERWTATFAKYLPIRRPLTVLDLGSGTGRFTPALARAFGGPVYGVEPSRRYREIAQRNASHPNVWYLDGHAEAIPIPNASCELALLFMSLHHITGHDNAFREIARVTAPSATVLIRCVFGDRMPDLHWYRYFPTARAALRSSHQRVGYVLAAAATAGFSFVTLDTVAIERSRSLREIYARLHSVMSTESGPIPGAEVSAGLAAMARDVADHGDLLISPPADDLLVLRRNTAR